jgi:uncharacterized membrane protein (TIGR02234 family)
VTLARTVVALLAAGAVALFAVTRAWASANVRTPGLPTDQVSVSGIDAAPILAGLAVVIVAAALGVVAAGGWLRQVIGLLIAAVAGVAALRALTLNAGGTALGRALRDSTAYIGGINPPVDGAIWPWVATGAFAAAALLGVVVAVRGRSWPRMSARYERATPSPAALVDDSDLWRAQDEGQDPTLADGPR